MSDPFADPANPTGIDYNDIQHSLLLVQVLSYEDHVPTVHTKPGERNPAIRANVTVLDGPRAGHVYEDALIFPKVLQSQLRSRIGKMVLGRLTQGEARQGQSPPWRLDPATDQDRNVAQTWMNSTARATAQQGAPAQGGSYAPPPATTWPPPAPEPPF